MLGWFKNDRKDFDKLFNEIVRPELVDAMGKPDFNPPLNELSNENVSFLLVAVSGETPNQIGEHLGEVSKIARECGWWADYLFSNLAVRADGKKLPNVPPPSSRQTLVAQLVTKLGDNCKSLGGESAVPWGDYGNANRKVYGPLFPSFIGMVSELHQQPHGSHVEASPL